MIGDAIQRLSKTNDEMYSLVGKVLSVDEDKRTCDVEPINGDAVINNVRLQADLEGKSGLVLFPKEGSHVVVTFLNKQTGYVALCSEVDKISFSKNNNDLLEMMKELIGIMKEFQLSTNVGATIKVMPHIVTRLEILENQFKDILK